MPGLILNFPRLMTFLKSIRERSGFLNFLVTYCLTFLGQPCQHYECLTEIKVIR